MSSAKIPIENIYYLLCYAWDALEEAELTAVSLGSDMDLSELLARVLATGLTHQLKRGLDRSYVEHHEEIAGIRGRLDLAASVKRNAFMRSRTVCRFDELSPDVPHNRIIKATLHQLLSLPLPASLRALLRELVRRMVDVSDIRLTRAQFARVTLDRNNAYYRFLLQVCEIIHQNILVGERGSDAVFRDFTRDDRQMANLFERFLRNFYSRERRDLDVSAPRFRWNAEGEAEHLGYLPEMRTDIVLRTANECVVLDAKYYAQSLGERFSKASLHSENLYQLFTYMSHLAIAPGRAAVGGILLYPRTSESLRVRLSLFGHPFLAATVNLAAPWPTIRRELLQIVEGLPAVA